MFKTALAVVLVFFAFAYSLTGLIPRLALHLHFLQFLEEATK
jgi:hypothetical protein